MEVDDKAMIELRKQKNEAVLKALENEFDYVCQINVKDNSYVLYSSEKATLALPHRVSDDYNGELWSFNRKYVVPEEFERVTACMQVEHVVRELEDKNEYILYASVCEQGEIYYKKLRFCYLDERKEELLLSRVDISDIVREQKLREQEERRRRAFLENMPVICFTCEVLLDEKGEPYDFMFTYSNRIHAKMMKMDCQELVGKRFYADLHETDRRWLSYYYDTACLGNPHVLKDYNSKTGRYYLVHTFQEQEGICGCIALDITEGFFLERELEKSRENMRYVLKATTDLVFQYDLKRRRFTFFKMDKDRSDQSVSAHEFIGEMVKRGYLCRDYEAEVWKALKKIQDGSHEVFLNIKARKRLKEPFQWYKLAFFDYKELKTHERCVLGYMQNIEQIQTRQEILKREAQTDPLTGILNAREGRRQVKKSLETRGESGCSALFIMDIDDFKRFNDTLGHQAGDETLKVFARILKNTFRAEDIVYRLGGDEFVVFVNHLEDPERIIGIIMERFFRNTRQVEIGGIRLSSSVGVYASSGEHAFEHYYAMADKALYETKHNGKNWYTLILEN
mgnify:FL=1